MYHIVYEILYVIFLACSIKTDSLSAMHLRDITGHLVLIMAPTGSGKGTLVSHIRSVFPVVTHTVSCTTRERRPQEVDGVNYYFLTRQAFTEKIEANEFLEWAEFGGNLYGTLRSELVDRLSRGEVVICEIEVQGVLQLLTYIPREHKTLIYIDAGDWDTLVRRARARAPISDTEIALRHERYLEEVTHKELADIVVYNRDGEIEKAQEHMIAIIKNIISKTESHT